jgi:hypothetical protein
MLVPRATNTMAVTESAMPRVAPKWEATSPITAVTTPMQRIDTTKQKYPLHIPAKNESRERWGRVKGHTCGGHESEQNLPEERDEVHHVVQPGRLLLVGLVAGAHGEGLDELLLPGGGPDQQGRVGALHQLVHGVLKHKSAREVDKAQTTHSKLLALFDSDLCPHDVSESRLPHYRHPLLFCSMFGALLLGGGCQARYFVYKIPRDSHKGGETRDEFVRRGRVNQATSRGC